MATEWADKKNTYQQNSLSFFYLYVLDYRKNLEWHCHWIKIKNHRNLNDLNRNSSVFTQYKLKFNKLCLKNHTVDLIAVILGEGHLVVVLVEEEEAVVHKEASAIIQNI